MAIECERKFLVNTGLWQPATEGKQLIQGYISNDPQRVVRVRIADKQAFLTIKGKNCGISRVEFDYQISVVDAKELLKLCDKPLVEKIRYREVFAGNVWEIDCFSGANNGLVVAEIELADELAEVPLPPWVDEEVSDDPRYYNSNLIDNPYSVW